MNGGRELGKRILDALPSHARGWKMRSSDHHLSLRCEAQESDGEIVEVLRDSKFAADGCFFR